MDGGEQADLSSTVKKLRWRRFRWRRIRSFFVPLQNMLRSRNEITTRKRDSPRLPTGQIRISSGDKPVRDSVHRSWTFRISFLLATGRNHGANAFVDDSLRESQRKRRGYVVGRMDRGNERLDICYENWPPSEFSV